MASMASRRVGLRSLLAESVPWNNLQTMSKRGPRDSGLKLDTVQGAIVSTLNSVFQVRVLIGLFVSLHCLKALLIRLAALMCFCSCEGVCCRVPRVGNAHAEEGVGVVRPPIATFWRMLWFCCCWFGSFAMTFPAD